MAVAATAAVAAANCYRQRPYLMPLICVQRQRQRQFLLTKYFAAAAEREKKNINERFSEFNVCVLFSSVANAV